MPHAYATYALLALHLVMGFTLIACSDSDEPQMVIDVLPDPTCDGFFGQPNAKSGMDESQCSRSCRCPQTEAAFGSPLLESPLFEFEHLNPMMPLPNDPYQESTPTVADGQVCSISVDAETRSYRLSTEPIGNVSAQQITHVGPCGACSSLHDLYVYAANVDLTDPVRQCGIVGIGQGMTANVECLRAIGFSEACATIWYYNTQHTRTQCLDECLTHLSSPYVTMEGQLNPCLECDEVQSGPIFKAHAGRTRRNSGLASAICRPCNTVSQVPHDYLTP